MAPATKLRNPSSKLYYDLIEQGERTLDQMIATIEDLIDLVAESTPDSNFETLDRIANARGKQAPDPIAKSGGCPR